MSVQASELAWGAVSRVIYRSLPSSAGINGKGIQALNPITGGLGSAVFAGSEPDLLSVSTKSKSLDRSSGVQRFVLTGVKPDINLPLGSALFMGCGLR